MATAVQDFRDSVAVLGPTLQTTVLPVTPSLYGELDERFDGFRGHVLVARHEFHADWPGWECHPAGDEIVALLDGHATMRLREPHGEVEVVLDEPGRFVVIPAGTWHTAHIDCHALMLFITPGEGTENRATPP